MSAALVAVPDDADDGMQTPPGSPSRKQQCVFSPESRQLPGDIVGMVGDDPLARSMLAALGLFGCAKQSAVAEVDAKIDVMQEKWEKKWEEQQSLNEAVGKELFGLKDGLAELRAELESMRRANSEGGSSPGSGAASGISGGSGPLGRDEFKATKVLVRGFAP